MTLQPSFKLGFLLPLVLVLLGAVEVGLRLLPAETFTYRAWEAVTREPVSGAPFGSSLSYWTPTTYGDLAALGNLPQHREYRSEQFTTDRLGYRNPPGLAEGEPVDAILLGTSFSVGAGMDDDETLAAQIGRLSDRTVYNASGPEFLQATALTRTQDLSHQLRLRGRTVIYEFLERYDPPPPRAIDQQRELAALLVPPCTGHAAGGLSAARCTLARLVGPSPISPLRILTDRAYRQAENGAVLPNQGADNVVELRLKNGDTMLFLPLDLASAGRTRSEARTADYFVWLQGELRQLDLELLVVLTPDKSTVYSPLLEQPLPAADQAAAFLDGLAAALTARRVETVNLVGPLRASAASGLPRREYAYWRDDTHWSPSGIRVAADAILERWKR